MSQSIYLAGSIVISTEQLGWIVAGVLFFIGLVVLGLIRRIAPLLNPLHGLFNNRTQAQTPGHNSNRKSSYGLGLLLITLVLAYFAYQSVLSAPEKQPIDNRVESFEPRPTESPPLEEPTSSDPDEYSTTYEMMGGRGTRLAVGQSLSTQQNSSLATDDQESWITTPKDDRYGIQVGAYQHYGNAHDKRIEFQTAGHQVDIVEGSDGFFRLIIKRNFRSRASTIAYAEANLREISWYLIELKP